MSIQIFLLQLQLRFKSLNWKYCDDSITSKEIRCSFGKGIQAVLCLVESESVWFKSQQDFTFIWHTQVWKRKWKDLDRETMKGIQKGTDLVIVLFFIYLREVNK